MPTTLFRIRSLLMLPIAAAIFAISSLLLPHAVEAGGGGCHPGEPLTASHATTVTMTKNCFGPTVAYVQPGDDVTFVNRDPGMHTITSAAASWGDNTSNYEGLFGGASFTQSFSESGVYPYYCMLHAGMVGAIVVGYPQPDEAAAVSRTGGSAGQPASSDSAATNGDGDRTITAVVASALAAVAVAVIGAAAATLYVRNTRTRHRDSTAAAN